MPFPLPTASPAIQPWGHLELVTWPLSSCPAQHSLPHQPARVQEVPHHKLLPGLGQPPLLPRSTAHTSTFNLADPSKKGWAFSGPWWTKSPPGALTQTPRLREPHLECDRPCFPLDVSLQMPHFPVFGERAILLRFSFFTLPVIGVLLFEALNTH